MVTRSENRKRKNTKEKKGRRFWRQLIFRLFAIACLGAILIAIGHVFFGWQPFGDNTARLDKAKDIGAGSTEVSKELGNEIEGIIEAGESLVDESLPFDNTDQPELAEATPEPTPEPTPKPKDSPTPAKPKTGTDEDKLDEFLESQF